MNGGRGNSRSLILAMGGLTIALCTLGFYVASSFPDGLETIAARLGFAGKATALVKSPLPDYQFPYLRSPARRNAMAAMLGAALCFVAAFGIGKYSSGRQSTRPSAKPNSRPNSRNENPVAPGSARSLE